MTLDEAIKYEDETVENYAKILEDYEILDEEDKLLFAEAEAKWRFYFEEHRQFAEWLKDYKRLLEQKPCSDAISRKAVYEQINSWNSNGEYSYTNATYYLMKRIRNIPSVTPQQKRGKWLNGELIPNDITGHWYAECSECGKMRIVDNYCPNCGGKNE